MTGRPEGLSAEDIERIRTQWAARREDFAYDAGRWLATLDAARDSRPVGACGGCGGPHRFDTSVPSPLWNEVIRAAGLSDYLCTSCIVEAFVNAGWSFDAELYGDTVNREGNHVPVIRVQVDDRPLDQSYGDLAERLRERDSRPLGEGLREALAEVGLPETASIHDLIRHHRNNEAAANGAWKISYDIVRMKFQGLGDSVNDIASRIEARTEDVPLGVAQSWAGTLRASLSRDFEGESDTGPGWWHPADCVDLHDEDHNCLDEGGSIIGWRDHVVSARLAPVDKNV